MSMNLWTSPLDGYSDSAQARKDQAHKSAMTFLRKFAKEQLGLNKDQFRLSSNKAGIAISGEVTLHTDPFGSRGLGIYIQVSDGGSMGWHAGVLFRTCKSRTDYTGGQNNFCDIHTLQTSRFTEMVKRLVDLPH